MVLLRTHASAQQQADLQQQLQQLKQQYEQTTKDLQQRIAVLEQQIQAQNEAGTQASDSSDRLSRRTRCGECCQESPVRKLE
jgi:hypothetical protein